MFLKGDFVMRPDRWLWVLALCAGGCASKMEVYSPETAPEYLTARETSFFRHGPSQPGRPDKLAANTFVQLQSKDPAYCVVRLPDGRSGYVATEDLRVAPPAGRAVADGELFPEQFVRVDSPLPEPDFSLPIEEVPETKAGR